MNLRCGLFRIWIVASVLWIGAIAAWAYKDLGHFERNGIFIWEDSRSDFERLDGKPTKLQAAREQEKRGKLVSHPLPHFAGYSIFLSPLISDDERTRRIDKVEAIVTDVQRIVNETVIDELLTERLPLAFGPPIIAFVSALVLFWIFAGFKKSTAK